MPPGPLAVSQPEDHCESEPDSQPTDAAQSTESMAAPITSVADSQDQAPSPSLPSTSADAGVHAESVGSRETVSWEPDQDQNGHSAAPSRPSVEQTSGSLTKGAVLLSTTPPIDKPTAAVSDTPTSPSTRRQSGGLTKGEIPTFFSLGTSPPALKRRAAARRAVHSKGQKSAAGKSSTVSATAAMGKKSAAALVAAALKSKKGASASKKSNAAELAGGKVDDRRLTFVTNKAIGDAKDLPAVTATSEKQRSRSSVRPLEDSCDADVEDIMDQDADILLDVSGCSECFDGDNSDINTLVPSSDDPCNLTIVAGRRSSKVSAPPSNAERHVTGAEIPEGDWVDDVFVGTVAHSKESPEGDVTSLLVTDMELTNVNVSKSPALSGSTSGKGTPVTAHDSTTDVKQQSQQHTKPMVNDHVAEKHSKESAREKNDDRSSASTQPRSRRTITVSKPSSEPKITAGSEVDDHAMEALPKKVAAYMSKPGKIVYSTAQRRSSSTEPKSRSKSRSVLPLQSRPRSKQPLVLASAPADSSPSSAFSFVGTPKEDMVARPAAMLAARQKYISLDDSVVVSAPAEKPPVVRQRSLSAADNAQACKMSADEFSSSPHGIMLVLRNGRRTKPRMARSKSVRYGASETVCTPPPVQQQKLSVPLTPYAAAPKQPSSVSANDVAGVETVPESPVFTSTATLAPQQQVPVTQPAVNVAADHSQKDDQGAAQDTANVDKVSY